MENIGYCAFAGQKVRRLMLPEGLRCVEPLAFMAEMDDDAEMELYIGIAAGVAITLITGQVTALELMGNMGGGVSGMFETILVTLLVASLCGLIRAYGGFESILAFIRRVFRGKRGGQLGIGLLVGLMDIATANNTVAIVMANPIASQMARTYDISRRKTASLLDTFSCVFQGVVPYGAQMLVAISAAAELGFSVSAFQIMPLLFYPSMLFISSLICIFLLPERGDRVKAKK